MSHSSDSIQRFYDGWQQYNESIISVVETMTGSQLARRVAPERWPVWATGGHIAGVRVYWLCEVLDEPVAETTPFPDPLTGVGWEDDEDTPRGAGELVRALETSWHVIEACLHRWTPTMLEESFGRPSTEQTYTRQSVLMRLLSHDAYHCGELSLTLFVHGLPQIDLWPAASEVH